MARHFADEAEMQAFFASVYRDEPAPEPTDPEARERRREIAERPAFAALWDFTTFLNFQLRIGTEGERDGAGNRSLTCENTELRAVCHAFRALTNLVETGLGQAVLTTLARCLPRAAAPDRAGLARQALRVLRSEVGRGVLRGLESWFGDSRAN